MNKPRIDLPLLTSFTVACEGKDATLVVVPRRGCDMCYLKCRELCGDMCCGIVDRRDKESVQFVKIETAASPVVLNTEIDLLVQHSPSKEEETANSDNN